MKYFLNGYKNLKCTKNGDIFSLCGKDVYFGILNTKYVHVMISSKFWWASFGNDSFPTSESWRKETQIKKKNLTCHFCCCCCFFFVFQHG